MTWIQIVYLGGLLYLGIDRRWIQDRDGFRLAWICFGLIPLSWAVLELLRLMQMNDGRAQELIDVWEGALPALFFGVSFLFLLKALVPAEKSGEGE
ncbi:MAG: hypothetical protein AAF591_02000 [Verrucomicrobiota bacterium]